MCESWGGTLSPFYRTWDYNQIKSSIYIGSTDYYDLGIIGGTSFTGDNILARVKIIHCLH
jgi:hypothetical protein